MSVPLHRLAIVRRLTAALRCLPAAACWLLIAGSSGAGASGAVSLGNDVVFAHAQTPTTIDVHANDHGTWAARWFTQPMNGRVSDGGSTLIYTPGAGSTGFDHFFYAVMDDARNVSVAYVIILVVAPPAAVDDTAETEADAPIAVRIFDNDTGTWVGGSFTEAGNGRVSYAEMALLYEPDPGFVGVDTFDYTATDVLGVSSTARVTVTVKPVDVSQQTSPVFTCSGSDAFCNRIAGSGLDGRPAYGRGAALVDVDGDGRDDLFVADTDARRNPWGYGVSRIFLNKGGARFEEVDVGFRDTDLLGTWGASFADYDNDGDPDVLLLNGGGTTASTLALYENRMNVNGSFVPVTEAAGIAVANASPSRWWGASWSDFNRDGLSDVVVTRVEGRPLLFRNEGEGRFTEVAEQLGIDIVFDAQEQGKNPVWIDHDGDGDEDLYIAGLGDHAFYENVAGTHFRNITAAALGFVVPAGVDFSEPVVFAAAASDFNQDGADDLYLGRWFLQDLVLINDGTGRFLAFGKEAGIDAEGIENTMGMGVGDLFDDGYADVYIGTGSPGHAGEDLIYCNGSGTGFVRCSETIAGTSLSPHRTRSHGAVFGDIDNDGHTDLFVNLGGHPLWDIDHPGSDSRERGALWIRQPDGSSSTVTLTLEGTASNRDATGAKIEIDLGDRVHHRRIRSTQGFQSQNSRAIVIGMGSASAAEVTISWPSGAVSRLTVEAGARVHVVEGSVDP